MPTADSTSSVNKGRLSPAQRDLLDALARFHERGYRWVSGPQLAPPPRTAHGAHQTAASLVRRGYVKRTVNDGIVRYRAVDWQRDGR